LPNDCFASPRLTFPKNMGVPADQFLAYFSRDFVNIEAFLFRSDLGMHDNYQEQIAQLLAQIGVVLRINGPGDFVSLLQQRRNQRGVGLFAVPRATLRRAQLGDYVAKPFKFSHSEQSRRIGCVTDKLSHRDSAEVTLALSRRDPSASARDDILNPPE